MAADLGGLLADLDAETDDLDGVVIAAGPGATLLPTPAEGWSVGDTIGHLWYFDREGRQALEDPAGFTANVAEMMREPESFLQAHLEEIRRLDESLLTAWREERRLLIDALRAADPAVRVPWYGPPMSPMSFGTARLMETWAHGQDVADAVGARRTPTDRLRHIAHLGVRTRGFSYAVKGREMPDVPVFVALAAPSGAEWTWGDVDAADSVRGSALDFCLLVTQRRLLDELDLQVTGEAAAEWLSIAQAFAGYPSTTDVTRRGLPQP
jgi:uncharacterized protein (TIGR03084 family)